MQFLLCHQMKPRKGYVLHWGYLCLDQEILPYHVSMKFCGMILKIVSERIFQELWSSISFFAGAPSRLVINIKLTNKKIQIMSQHVYDQPQMSIVNYTHDPAQFRGSKNLKKCTRSLSSSPGK